MYMNQITICGNATRDAETKETQSGKKRTSFGVAVKAGENSVDFFEVVYWERECPVRKGNKVLVQGAMRSREYEGRTYWTIVADKVQFQFFPRRKHSKDEENEVYIPAD